MLTLIALLFVSLVLVGVVIAFASRHKKGAGRPLKLIGQIGTVERDIDPEGAVLVCGELLPARSRDGKSILRAECPRVRVVGARGHCLEVAPESQMKDEG